MKKVLPIIAIIALLCLAFYFVGHYYGDGNKTPSHTDKLNEFDKAIYDSLVNVSGEDEIILAEITLENAVDAIKQIETDKKYHAVFDIEHFYGDKTRVTHNSVQIDGEKYRIEISGDEDKTITCDGKQVKAVNNQYFTSGIVESSEAFSWNEQIGVVDIDYFLNNADNELIKASFAKSVGRQGGNIIYIEFYYPQLDQTEKFYISADYGIVLAAQTYMGQTLTYRLTTSSFTADYSSEDISFGVNPQ